MNDGTRKIKVNVKIKNESAINNHKGGVQKPKVTSHIDEEK